MNKNELTQVEQMAQDHAYIGDVLESNYIGQGDDFDFNGQRSFAGEKRTGRDFGFKIKNDSPTDAQVVLCPAFFESLSEITDYGMTAHGILQDGDIATIGADKVTGTALDPSKKISSLLAFIKRNPTRVVRMVMKSTTSDQFEKNVKVENVAPFNSLGDMDIQLTDYFSPGQLNTTKIDVDLLETGKVLDFNDQNVIILTVAGNSTLTINLKVGGILNHASKLKKKAGQAHRNLTRGRH